MLTMFGSSKNNEIKRLLVVRFSAMGDVAMTVPVVHALAIQNPHLRITVLTRDRMTDLYGWVPANVQLMGINLKDYDGIMGLTKLYKQLSKGNFDAVADLHDVIRTKYLRTCFKMAGTKVAVINKGRDEKKALIGNGQSHEALKPMLERYAEVFRELGLKMDMSAPVLPSMRGHDLMNVNAFAGKKGDGEKWIGVAPFAAHAQKVYPLDRMRKVVNMLADKGYKVFLFGAGKAENEEMHRWERNGVLSTSGKLGGLHNEMLLMSRLDLMVSMDSANMHIASIVGTKVLSIWGATHPKAGFSGYCQSPQSEMQIDLPCRPCSIYGKTPCKFGDMRCMNFTPEDVVKKVEEMTHPQIEVKR